ncbi:MAG: DUF1289 domain-containing protein [Betaproteobacteria bacterium]|jgi:predicted Fe-S protein YdhL (DUF1289 family)|nr:DUF1289 domain-containing protein [Betaproteobacteria bacterium]HMV19674.1 DUF1289 domain-containing protein [Rhodocyclaceae bacterium]HMW76913.1 DUF1289 domain-containing protein [Rhodocyclaceae bacterium]HNE42421.1 DUF1289 domain-containing protein [Rhodocyclaceae bacterium]HNL22463.1 DUF1289 domain-containing protein [Rhodocyclaceae bacterium]
MVPSPCIDVCRLDRATGLCQGCLRNVDEIAAWGQADDAARIIILAAVAKRRQELDPWDGELRCDCKP